MSEDDRKDPIINEKTSKTEGQENSQDETQATGGRRESFPWLEDDNVEANVEEDDGSKRKIMLGVIAGGLILGAGALWFLFGQAPEDEDVPLITASNDPVRTEPDDPGGMEVDHQDRLVYDRANGEEQVDDASIGETPEQPLERPQAEDSASDMAEDDMSSDVEETRAEAAPEPVAEDEMAEPTPVPQQAEPANPAMPSATLANSYRMQLASFVERSAAETGWQRLQDRYPGELLGLQYMIQRATLNDGRTVYRLQVGPFRDRAAANSACNALKAAGGDCLVVAP